MAAVTFTQSDPALAAAIRTAATRDGAVWERKPAAGVPVHGGGMKVVN